MLATVMISTVACAQDGTVTGSEHESGIKIDLRFWAPLYSPAGDGDAIETFVMPFGGLTLTYTPKQLPSWGFMLTTMFGGGSSGYTSTDLDGSNQSFGEGEQETFRYDVQFLARYSIPDTKVFLLGGVRFVSFEREGSFDAGDATDVFVSTQSQFSNSTGEENDTLEFSMMTFEFGAGVATDIDQSGRHRLFANGVVGLGVQIGEYTYNSSPPSNSSFQPINEDEDWTDFAFSADLNFGYQYIISDHVDLSVRYRVLLIAQQEDDLLFDAMHGPEFSIGFRF